MCGLRSKMPEEFKGLCCLYRCQPKGRIAIQWNDSLDARFLYPPLPIFPLIVFRSAGRKSKSICP